MKKITIKLIAMAVLMMTEAGLLSLQAQQLEPSTSQQILQQEATISQQAQLQAPMTLHDCMEYAVSHSTKMRVEAADRNDERWQRRQALLQMFTPYVEAQGYAYYRFGRKPDPGTNTYSDETTFENGYSVNASLTLFDGFRTINNWKMSSTVAKMGLNKEQKLRDEICLATMEAYCNVIYYIELEAVLTAQVATAQTARDRAVRQEEVGQKGHADVMQMESELAQKQYQLIQTTNKKQDALITLKDILFWPVGEELLIATRGQAPFTMMPDTQEQQPTMATSQEPQTAETATQEPFATEVTTQEPLTTITTLQEPLTTLATLQDVANTAKALLPAAQLAELDVRRARLDLKMAQGAYSPKLSLSGGWSSYYYTYPGKSGYAPQPFGDQIKNNAGELVQLSLSIPIYDQWQRRLTLQRKKNALARAQAERDQTMRDIENEVARAINDRDGASAAFSQANKLAGYREEAFRLSAKQFENGLISAIEYQTASQSYLNAKAERIKALLVLQIKDSVVRYYMGEPYINQTMIF